MSHDVFAKRRAETDARLKRFEERLAVHLGADEAALIGDHTTVYVTGSGGRGEMSDASDLDLFLVRTEGKPSKIDAALLQTAIIRATRDCNIPEPSADGAFLELHSAGDFVKLLGSTDDDWSNKFTARMLLLLESRPVVGSASYERLIRSVIDGYWSVADAHQFDYLPYVFVNDVIRYWRVVLLNHESRLRAKEIELREAERLAPGTLDVTARMKVERSARSFKLHFPRAIICFASLAYLLAKTRQRLHVSKEDMKAMIALTPFERLDEAASISGIPSVMNTVDAMKPLYEGFLQDSAYPKKQLMARFEQREFKHRQRDAGRAFGDQIFEMLRGLGTLDGGRVHPLYRSMLV